MSVAHAVHALLLAWAVAGVVGVVVTLLAGRTR
jgi:hypothetical protein